MGSSHSTLKTKSYSEKEFKELAEKTHFNVYQVKEFYQQYIRLANSQRADGSIDLSEFQAALSLRSNAFAHCIFSAFDKNNNSSLDFPEYLSGLSALSPEASVQEKARFCFNIYDTDRNGTIEQNELNQILTFSLQENTSISISQDKIDKIVSSTFQKMDLDGDHKISYQEFEDMALKNPSILNCANFKL